MPWCEALMPGIAAIGLVGIGIDIGADGDGRCDIGIELIEPWSIGMASIGAMGVGAGPDFLDVGFFAADFFAGAFLDAAWFGAAFLVGAFLADIGIGMVICCAAAGTATASVETPKRKPIRFTQSLAERRRTPERTPGVRRIST